MGPTPSLARAASIALTVVWSQFVTWVEVGVVTTQFSYIADVGASFTEGFCGGSSARARSARRAPGERVDTCVRCVRVSDDRIDGWIVALDTTDVMPTNAQANVNVTVATT